MSDTPSGNADMALKHEGEVKTQMHCHNCSKDFLALLDYSINGDHIAECPHCGHSHHRTIIDGRITNKRWGSSNGSDDSTKVGIKARRVWKHTVLPMKTTGTSEFLRQLWLEKYTR